MSICLETIKPHLTPGFVDAFRALGKQVGYRNLGRAIAYAKLPPVAMNTHGPTAYKPKVSRNGRKGKHAWYCLKGRAGVPKSRRSCCCYKVCETCLTMPEHRFTHQNVLHVSYLVDRHENPASADKLHAIAAAMPRRECCGYPMGITPDSLDPTHWRYQCAVEPKHQEEARIAIGPH